MDAKGKGGMSMVINDDPGLHRRHVRNKLRNYRSVSGHTQQEVVDELDWSLSKLIRIENGTNTVATTDLKALLALYGVVDADVVGSLVEAARASRKKPWWYDFRALIRPQFAQLLAHEAGAVGVSAYSPTTIPSLLQTEGYVRSLREETVPDPEEREQLVQLLMRRQQLLAQDETLEAQFVVDEAALRRWIGGASIMSAQLEHILDCMSRPRNKIQVMPFAAGAHPALAGPFVLLELEERDDDVVFLEGGYGDGDTLSHDDKRLRQRYVDVFGKLQDRALSRGASARLIREIQKEFTAV